MSASLPYQSTLVVRTSPNGAAEYRLEHPGKPRSPTPPFSSPRPALRQSRIGRRVHFAPQLEYEGDREDGTEEEARFCAQKTPYCPPAPAPAQQSGTYQAGQSVPQYPLPYGQDLELPLHGYPSATASHAATTPPHTYGSPSFRPSPSVGSQVLHSPCRPPPAYHSVASSQGIPFPAYHQQIWVAEPPVYQQHQHPYPSPQQQPQPFGYRVDGQGPQPHTYPASAAEPLQEQQRAGQAQAMPPQPQPPPPQPPPPPPQQQQQQQQGHQPSAPPSWSHDEPARQQAGPARMLDAAQLQVTANSVSITVTAAHLGRETPSCDLQGAARAAADATAGAAKLAVPGTPGMASHAEAKLAGTAMLASTSPTAGPAASPQLPTRELVSCQTQTEAASGEAQQHQHPAAAQREPPPQNPTLTLPLPPGIQSCPSAQPALHGPALPPGIPLQQLPLQHHQQGAVQGAPRQPSLLGSNRGHPVAARELPRALEPQPSGAALSYDRDLSCWGQTHMEDSYFEDGTTSGSLSSGLSPRESHTRRLEWDQAEALKALAQGAETYARSARQQRMGRAGPVTAADVLPAKLAVQQLSSLAGMSRKVQEAIQHSQRVFEHQAEVLERAVLQRAFYAWKNLRDARALSKRREEQIRRRMRWSVLRQCTAGWLRLTGQQEHQKAAVLKAQSILARHLVQRCFKEWVRQCSERQWKIQLALKDQQLQLLVSEVRHMESRPVRYMQRFRGRRWLQAWRDFADQQRSKKQRWGGAVGHDRQQHALKAWVAWQEMARWKAGRRGTLQRASWLVQRLRLQQWVSAWREAVGSRTRKESMLAAAAGLRRLHMLRRAVGGWRYITWLGQTARDAAQGRQLQMWAAAFRGWWQHVELVQTQRALLAEAEAVQGARRLARALYGWRGYVDGRQARALQEEHNRLAELTGRLQEENTHLRQGNERLGRIIDSGEWGRERVTELSQAGELLKKERDALLDLVQRLQQQQEIQQQRNQPQMQEPDELPVGHSHLHISAGGIARDSLQGGMRQLAVPCSPRPLSPCNSPPLSPSHRNKLLVRGGSSFNAMVRALKQDLITSGTLNRNPDATYKVDQLSLHHVALKPGGQLEVEALASPNLTGVAFGRARASSPCKRVEPKQGDLLQAALRLQSLGGRSVALGKRV